MLLPVPRLTRRVYSWWNNLGAVLHVPSHRMSVDSQSRRRLSTVAYPIILFCHPSSSCRLLPAWCLPVGLAGLACKQMSSIVEAMFYRMETLPLQHCRCAGQGCGVHLEHILKMYLMWFSGKHTQWQLITTPDSRMRKNVARIHFNSRKSVSATARRPYLPHPTLSQAR